ncbi:glutamyl tRNA synthetase cytoplasmic [Echinococcus multilocularis]|uniref:Proline--tRNA ligase n=1 Tax=Echinococcus multilocularis TaxID=6211 RepID=A0A068Y6M9_ECHMU|nr:glutamyl tRNA synthetase cytoplasmic [Echinococcus multilocularis]
MDSHLHDFLINTCRCAAATVFDQVGIQPCHGNKQLVYVANWIRFARVQLSNPSTFTEAINELDNFLAHRSFLVSDTLSYADIAVWARLECTKNWNEICTSKIKGGPLNLGHFVNLRRFCNFLRSHPGLTHLGEALVKNPIPLQPLTPQKCTASNNTQPKSGRAAKDMKFEEGGKFEDLPDAKVGEVVVRFPPEASGFMHIGHAKAALLNYHYKETFKGKLILRFDDTNPEKENAVFEEAILTDLPRLGVKWDTLSYTSNYFDRMIELCTQLISDGKAYADDTDLETMRSQREARQESACRNNSVEKNLAMWKAMQEGTAHGLKTCIRAKIDMSSDNGAMRDPTIYRCKLEPHIRTGTKYKVFPIYDFACPIVDSLEGVTHALRTSEYNDRNCQYYWMCDALKIRKPIVVDFSRLALQSTILSKRKLTWFVEQGLVSGWDDPRMPTVRGILRHGLTPEGLRQFILAQGSSKSTGTMEWDKIWAFNKKVIDPVAPRYTALSLSKGGVVPVRIKGQRTDVTKQTPLHPKNPSVGEKTIVLAPIVFVEYADAECFTEGDNVTFVNWGNLRIVKIFLNTAGRIYTIDAELNLEDTDYKKTQKVTWLADPGTLQNVGDELALLTPLSCLTYGNLISKPLIGKDEDFKNFVNHNSVSSEACFGDSQMRNLKKGDIIQLQRKGFYICDQPYRPSHPSTWREAPCVLIYIPDGATKERPTTGSKFKVGEAGDSKQQQQKKGDTSAQKESANLTPEEAAKRAEKERLKEEKKAARKAGREKAKQEQRMQSTEAPLAVAPATTAVVPKPPSVETPMKLVSTVPKEKSQHVKKTENSAGGKKQTRLGMEVKKEDDTAEWYTQVIRKAELLEYYDISGCYILRPWSYFIWSQIQAFFDKAIAALGVDNAYFPMFVSKGALEQEKEHIADFAPEVAWVTRSGSSDLAEPIALRPTSETIMYPAFAKWIKSHRDLPLKLNQWSNIVRWEFKHPTPFLRTREFLWQEGHTAFASKEEAEVEVLTILNLYRSIYNDLLAIPCIRGRKTEREKFPGGEYTTTVEVFIGASGRAIQVMFEDPETNQPCCVYQNSWGITTRTIGVMIMVHSDNQGLVLPPRVARYQVVVVPCGVTAKTTELQRSELLEQVKTITAVLGEEAGLRVHLDDRDHVSPGWKFNHWELKGVPLRLEVGFKDLAKGEVTAVVRYTGEKTTIPLSRLTATVKRMLDDIHDLMLSRATSIQNSHILPAKNMEELTRALDKRCIVVAPFCGDALCEDAVRTESSENVVVIPGAPSMGAKSLCIPFAGELGGLKTGPVTDGSPCLRHPLCTKPAVFHTLFGRSY